MYSKPTFSALLTGVLVCLLFGYRMALADVWQQLGGAEACKNYRPMTEAQLNLAESLFMKMLQGTQIDSEWLRHEWLRLGYVLVEGLAESPQWLGLREAESPCRGQGVYLFNNNNPPLLVVQAPHAYHDLYTGEILAGLRREGMALLAWNSAKRHQRKAGKKMEADLAKRPDSLFVALTRALATMHPDARLIQIHGFDNQRRSTQAGASAAVILSGGSRWPSLAVESIAHCLQPMIDGPVLIYPRDVDELGATRNLHGRILRRQGHEGFVHVELNRHTRQRLRSEPALSAGFSACLANGMNK